MWQFAGGETYSLVREMGEMGKADIQVVIITRQGYVGPTSDRETELELYRSFPKTLRW